MVLETWGTVPHTRPKKKLKSKNNQKSYQHFYHFTIPRKFSWNSREQGQNGADIRYPQKYYFLIFYVYNVQHDRSSASDSNYFDTDYSSSACGLLR